MTETTEAPRSYWFVGASYGRTEDQTPRFLSEGIWENGYDDKHLDLVRSMQPGDKIAIKSSYTRKHNLLDVRLSAFKKGLRRWVF
ncbi:hypothetical protein [Cypionkella sp. TWP1-2-1b2]|uniref:hypothetical protein n=1 Tax=Cypionkella sp. TWP1-2-1b2 TaxID=2804675 RepID=UPI003CE9BC3D